MRPLLLLVLAGCPSPGPQMPMQPAGAGCPPASDVYVASYLTASTHTGWVLPLHDLKVDAITDQPEYGPIDQATAGALGVPAPPASAWLVAAGRAPCKLTVGGYYGAAFESPANVTYGVELSGCPAPPADQQQDAEAIVLASVAPPGACQVLAPQPVAARLGDTDAQGTWKRPVRETAMPPAFAPLVPPRECRAPDCEKLWSVAQVTVAGRPVAWAGAVNWLAASGGDPCSWKSESFAGFFVAGPDGAAVRVPDSEHLLMTAVLADAGGAKVVVAQGAGEYATYDYVAGAARPGRHLTWLLLPPEATAVDASLGPVCAQPSATPR